MPDRSHAEIQEVVRDVQHPAQGLVGKQKSLQSYLTGAWAADLLSKGKGALLPAEFTNKQAVISYDGKQAVTIRQGKLSRPMEVHIEPDDPRQEVKADDEEDFEAVDLNSSGLDHGSQLWSSIYAAQSSWFCGALRVEHDDFQLPVQNDGESNADYNARCDRFKRHFSPWQLNLDPIGIVTFLEQNLHVNLACWEFRIPYVELPQRFGDYKRGEQRDKKDHQDLMLKIGREQFPWLRTDEWLPAGNESARLNREATVLKVDDGVNVSYHVQGLNDRRTPDREWHELKQFPNVRGNPACYLVYGQYHAGQELADRFEPLDLPLFQWLRTRDWGYSFLASYAASASPDAIRIPDSALPEWMGLTPAQRAVFSLSRGQGGGAMTALIGDPMSLVALPEAVEKIEALVEKAEARVAALWPDSLIGPGVDAAKTVQQGTADAIARATEHEDASQQAAVDCDTRLVADFLRDSVTGFEAMANSHYKKGSGDSTEADFEAIAVMTGNEYVHKRKAKRGKVIKLKPADRDFAFTRTVSARDIRLSTLAARRMEADARYYRPGGRHSITEEEWYEAQGVTNVTEYLEEITADALHELKIPFIVQDYDDYTTQFAAGWFGLDQAKAQEMLGVDVQREDTEEPGVARASVRTPLLAETAVGNATNT